VSDIDNKCNVNYALRPMGAANSLRNGNNAQLFIMAADASGVLSKIYASDHQSRFINNCHPGGKKKNVENRVSEPPCELMRTNLTQHFRRSALSRIGLGHPSKLSRSLIYGTVLRWNGNRVGAENCIAIRTEDRLLFWSDRAGHHPAINDSASTRL